MSDEMPTSFVSIDEQPYETSVHMSDGTFVKSYRVPKALTVLPQHSHAYSHTSYIARGAVKAWKDGVFLRTVTAPDGILIEAHAKHLFQTLEDDTTLLCIHSVRLGEHPEIEDEHVVEVAAPTGFTFQEEEFDAWLADAQLLFRQHLARTGQDPDGAMLKNIPLGRQLANAGAMQITTARSNGRMFAYLLAMISPTLDQAGVLTAHLMLPFASTDCPGLGRKLQRATIEMLKAKGVKQVFARAGVRGDGPRLGSLYRRMGFAHDGTVHRLDL